MTIKNPVLHKKKFFKDEQVQAKTNSIDFYQII